MQLKATLLIAGLLLSPAFSAKAEEQLNYPNDAVPDLRKAMGECAVKLEEESNYGTEPQIAQRHALKAILKCSEEVITENLLYASEDNWSFAYINPGNVRESYISYQPQASSREELIAKALENIRINSIVIFANLYLNSKACTFEDSPCSQYDMNQMINQAFKSTYSVHDALMQEIQDFREFSRY